MQGFSADFASTIRQSHTAVVQVVLIRDGTVVATLEPHAGSVTADRTQSQMRTMQLEVIDRDGTLTPTDMTSLLAPFGSRIQIYRGVRITNVRVLTELRNAATPWTPQTSTGQMVGVQIDPADGSLTLGT